MGEEERQLQIGKDIREQLQIPPINVVDLNTPSWGRGNLILFKDFLQ